MTQKQFVAYGVIASLALTLLTALIEPLNADTWYGLAGIMFFVFGIWASVLLLKK